VNPPSSVQPRAKTRGRALLGAVLLLGSALPSVHAFAQDSGDEARLRKLEAEVRALQRKVFPGGAGATFQPEIVAPQSAPVTAAPSSTPITDLLGRMDAVEAQLARVTAETEQNSNRLSQLEAKQAAMTPPPADPVSPPPAASGSFAPPPTSERRPTTRPAASPPPSSTSSSAKPSAGRTQAVRAIEKPQSDDPGDDDYSYGFRLFDAKFYPEAEQQLKLYLQQYPKHPRVSYARNLLGRAYLEDNEPREAAKWFLQNYQADKKGPRAADSLLYLARSMKQLGDTQRACVALGEFSITFAAEAAARLKPDYDDTRRGLSCS
jgi:TolA-binding protein